MHCNFMIIFFRSKTQSHLSELEIQEHGLTTKHVNSTHHNSTQSDSSQSDSSQYGLIKSELENQSSGNDDNSMELTPDEMDSSDNEEPEEIGNISTYHYIVLVVSIVLIIGYVPVLCSKLYLHIRRC